MKRKGRESVEILSKDRLEKMTTYRLKMYLHSLHKLHEDIHYDSHAATLISNRITFKSDPRWSVLHDTVKEILSRREHLI